MPERIEDLPLVLTVEQVATALSLSRGSAYEGIRSGEIPHVRIGSRILIPRAMLATLLGETATAEARLATAMPVARSSQGQADAQYGGHAGVGHLTKGVD